eukprot:717998-Heterocapsa_arctica.AAC.1
MDDEHVQDVAHVVGQVAVTGLVVELAHGVLHAVHQVEAVLQHLLLGRKLLEVGSRDLVLQLIV